MGKKHFLNISRDIISRENIRQTTYASMCPWLTFIVYWDFDFRPDDVVSLLQTVSGDRRPLTAGMNQEVVVVSEPFNQLTCRNHNNPTIHKVCERSLIVDFITEATQEALCQCVVSTVLSTHHMHTVAAKLYE